MLAELIYQQIVVCETAYMSHYDARPHLQAMAVPEVAVVTEPHCRRKVTVPLVVGFQVKVVGSPTLKV